MPRSSFPTTSRSLPTLCYSPYVNSPPPIVGGKYSESMRAKSSTSLASLVLENFAHEYSEQKRLEDIADRHLQNQKFAGENLNTCEYVTGTSAWRFPKRKSTRYVQPLTPSARLAETAKGDIDGRGEPTLKTRHRRSRIGSQMKGFGSRRTVSIAPGEPQN